jgi:DnaJ-class molecular chaperone
MVYSERLYNQAKDLETRLWAAQPRCGICSGSGKVEVNGYEMDCGKCGGSGREH